MRDVKRQGAQGDVLFRRVKELPAGAVEVPREDGAPIVLAHSETGHNHVAVAPGARLYSLPGKPLLSFLQLADAPCEVEHQRSWDTHETMRLLGKVGTIWEVRRQREWTPEGWRQVAD